MKEKKIIGLDAALLSSLRANGHDITSVKISRADGFYIFNIDGQIVRSTIPVKFDIRHHKSVVSEITKLFNWIQK